MTTIPLVELKLDWDNAISDIDHECRSVIRVPVSGSRAAITAVAEDVSRVCSEAPSRPDWAFDGYFNDVPADKENPFERTELVLIVQKKGEDYHFGARDVVRAVERGLNAALDQRIDWATFAGAEYGARELRSFAKSVAQ